MEHRYRVDVEFSPEEQPMSYWERDFIRCYKLARELFVKHKSAKYVTCYDEKKGAIGAVLSRV